VLAIVGVGVFMCTLDSSIVSVSLPAIAEHFGVPVSAQIEWVIIAYLVIIAATLLTFGRLSDRIGRRRIWIVGLIVFTIGSAASGLAPTLWLLVLARVLQGVGASMLMAVSPAMLVSAFPANERGRALGLNSMVVAFGITAGPALGGAITASTSWRWIFYINLPIGIAGVIATWFVLPSDDHHERQRFDRLGALLLGLALAALTTGLSVGNEVGWHSPLVLGLGGLCVVASAAFVFQERRHEMPLLDRSLFQNRLFEWATISLVLSFVAAFAVSFILPIYYQQLRGFGMLKTGLSLTAFPLVIAAVAPVSGRIADRIGTRWLSATGMAILSVGLFLLSRIDHSTSIFGTIWPQLIAAFGMAMFQAPNNSAIMGSAPRDRQGAAAGMLATGRTTGQSLSVAIAGAVFGSLGGAAAGRELLRHPNEPQLVATFLHGFRWALIACALIAAVAIVTSLMRGKEQLAQ
jgi:EmrB/QacA subfamily drug resistance transporter